MGTQCPGSHVCHDLYTQRGSLFCSWCDVDVSSKIKKLSIARRGGGDETSTTYPVLESTCLVFTHQDLAARNLILDDNGRLWVIDWELAGWYPES